MVWGIRGIDRGRYRKNDRRRNPSECSERGCKGEEKEEEDDEEGEEEEEEERREGEEEEREEGE